MPVSDRASMAKTPDGTVDWKRVFEEPEHGLIALVTKSHTSSALRRNALLVIQKLYVREDDPAEVARLTAELTSLIPDNLPAHSLPHIAEAVAAILRRIKDYRIRKAAEFERDQTREKASKGKAKKQSPEAAQRRREEERQAARKRQRMLVIAAGSAAAVIVVAVGSITYFLTATPSLEEQLEPNRRLVEQMMVAAKEGQSAGPNPFGGRLAVDTLQGRVAVTADGIPQDACMSVAWVLLNRGAIIINGMTSKQLGLSVIKELCTRSGGPTTITWVPKQ